ncbi:MAG: hypothetical protein ACREPG_08735, partial [Candidatus Binatia bacterium]
MKQPLVNLIRRTVPRPVRNALRRPRATVDRIVAKTKFAFDHADQLSLRPGWNLACHPICLPDFKVFQTDPEQSGELDQFVPRCAAAMRLLDVGAHWGIFTLAALQFGGPTA